MNKRGITTVFIILAIVIVIALIGFTTLQKSQAEKYFSAPSNQEKLDQIKLEISNCIDQSTTNSLLKLGAQGGFYSAPPNHYKTEESEYLLPIQSFIPYYYYNQQALHPSKETVQIEFSKIFNEQLSECISYIESETIEISNSKPETKLKIFESKIEITTNPKTAINSNGNSLTLEESQTITKDSALNDIILLYTDMTNTKVETEGFNCLSCMEEFAINNNLYIGASNLDNDLTAFLIYENHTETQQSWVFINQEVI